MNEEMSTRLAQELLDAADEDARARRDLARKLGLPIPEEAAPSDTSTSTASRKERCEEAP